jgi:hypothetical protein
MNLLAIETSQLPAWESSKRSKNILTIGAVALFLGILELFAFLAVAGGPTTCPAGGCDMWIILADRVVLYFPLLDLGMITTATGAGIIAYGWNYDRHRIRGLILLALAIGIAFGLAVSTYVLSVNYLIANGIMPPT